MLLYFDPLEDPTESATEDTNTVTSFYPNGILTNQPSIFPYEFPYSRDSID